MFVCQAVKKDLYIKDFIEEQYLENLNMLYWDECKEYSTDLYVDANNKSDFDEYVADLVMEDINTK